MLGFGGKYYWRKRNNGGDSEGIVVVFAWMSSEERNLKNHVDLYSSLRMDSLVCHSQFLNMFLPDKAADLASNLVSELVKELKVKSVPLVFASFSGGPNACMYKVLQILEGICESELNPATSICDFRGRGEHEIALMESATYLIWEFEMLIKITLEGPEFTLPDNVFLVAQRPKRFRSHLEAFDKAWCSYLERFVVWKTNDAKLLEKDLAKSQEPELSEVSKHTSSSSKVIDEDMNLKPLKTYSPNQSIFAETDGARVSKAPAD